MLQLIGSFSVVSFRLYCAKNI